ncbi:MAG: hypothetical protein AAF602_24995, partial [Myxococcota bacterium]
MRDESQVHLEVAVLSVLTPTGQISINGHPDWYWREKGTMPARGGRETFRVRAPLAFGWRSARVNVVRIVPVDSEKRAGPGLHVPVVYAGEVADAGLSPLTAAGLVASVSTFAFGVGWRLGRADEAPPETLEVGTAGRWMLDLLIALAAAVAGRASGIPLFVTVMGFLTGTDLQQTAKVFGVDSLLEVIELPPWGLVVAAALYVVVVAPVARWLARDLWSRLHPAAAILGGPVLCGVSGAVF